MKLNAALSVAFALAATALAGCQQPAIEPAPNPERIDTTPVRKINRAFEREMHVRVAELNDTRNFQCFNTLSYADTPNTCKVPYGVAFTGSRGSYYLNTHIDMQPTSFQRAFDTPEWQDVLQLFTSAHEFRHYLDEREGRNPQKVYKPDDMSAAAVAARDTRRLNEFRADLFGITVVRAYHPDKADAFIAKLQAARREEPAGSDDRTHNALADAVIPVSSIAQTPVTMTNLIAQADDLYAKTRATSGVKLAMAY